MGRPTRSADHYDLRAWVDVGTGSSRSEVDAASAVVCDRRVGGEDFVSWGGSTDRTSRKIIVCRKCTT